MPCRSPRRRPAIRSSCCWRSCWPRPPSRSSPGRSGSRTRSCSSSAGSLLGFIPGLPSVELAPDVVFLLFLPPILFAAGYFTPIRDFKATSGAIVLLAVGLVLFTTFVVGVVAKLLVPEHGGGRRRFALGAIVAPPDAVAATAVFRRLGVPRRIVTILEGESLINDATALIAYRFAVIAATVGGFSIVDAGSTFVVASVGGIVVGPGLRVRRRPGRSGGSTTRSSRS